MKVRLVRFCFGIYLMLFITSCKDQSGGPVNNTYWTRFTKSSVPKLLDDNIHSIYISLKGEVWFGTDSGACSYRKGGSWSILPADSFNYYLYHPTRIAREVKAITESNNGGSIWFGLNGGGIVRWILSASQNSSGKASIRYLQDKFITGIAALTNGDVYTSTTDGASRYIFNLNPDPSFDGEWRAISDLSTKVNCVVVNQKNEWVYFGTDDLIKYYEKGSSSGNTHQISQGYRSPIISMAVQYDLNTLWCGKQSGVTSYNPGLNIESHYTTLNTDGKLPEGSINAVMTDFYGSTVWFGTNVGLVQLKGTVWKIFTQSEIPELPSDIIQALSFDIITKNLWIGTNKGIAVYNENGIKGL